MPKPAGKFKNDSLSFAGSSGKKASALHYTHFSVVMSKSRKLCFYAAVNIDGKQAKELLRVRTLSVTDICFEVGFESLGTFSSLFRKCVGDAPINYRRRERESLKRVPGCFIQMDGLKPSDQ